MIHNRFVSLILTAAAVVVLGAAALSVSSCQPNETEISVTGITVSTPSITITEGETSVISFTVEPADASVKDVSFSSSDTDVVTVDEKGRVTAVGPGTATITITTKDGGFKATVTVTVKAKAPAVVNVSGVKLDKHELSLKKDEKFTLTATVEPSDAADKSVSWKSSDTAVATVEDGEVVAVAAGTATITVTTTDGEFTDECKLTVTEDKPGDETVKVSGVKLDKHELSLKKDEKAALTATVEPSNASDKSVSWKSSATAVATVDGGEVVAVAAGTATITVTTTDGKFTDECKVTVTEDKPGDDTIKVTGVTLDQTELTIGVGTYATLVATVEPADATDKTVEWKSNKSSVAIVDDDGRVSGIIPGSATITVTTKDGGFKATCDVTVVNSAPPTPSGNSEFRAQYLEDQSSLATVGKVIHYKYGTNYMGTANQFLVLPCDMTTGEPVKDATASHFSAKSSIPGSISVSVTKVDAYNAFLVKVLKGDNGTYSDLSFTYTGTDGKTITQSTRLCIAPAAASSAFEYSVYANLVTATGSKTIEGTEGYSSVRFEYFMSSAKDQPVFEIFPKFNCTGPATVMDTGDMASYQWESYSSSGVLSITDKVSNTGVPYPEVTISKAGQPVVDYLYTDYKGNTKKRLFSFHVVQAYLDEGSALLLDGGIFCTEAEPAIIPKDGKQKIFVADGSGRNYYSTDVSFNWSSSDPSVATVEVVKGQGASYYCAEVSGKKVGKTTIKVTDVNGKTLVAYVTVLDSKEGHAYVEMGDGLKWAVENVGSRNIYDLSPQEYAWGSTTPGKSFDWDEYFDGNPQDGFSKYKIGKKTVLEPEDDTARQAWGGSWRMPTEAEWRTLMDRNKFEWTYSTDIGMIGYRVTSKIKGYEGTFIFLPAVYLIAGSVAMGGGVYWSSTLSGEDESNAVCFFIDFEETEIYDVSRCYGTAIRPVWK